jgi:hypothetical protein
VYRTNASEYEALHFASGLRCTNQQPPRNLQTVSVARYDASASQSHPPFGISVQPSSWPPKLYESIIGLLIERNAALQSVLRPPVGFVLHSNQSLVEIDMAKGRSEEF